MSSQHFPSSSPQGPSEPSKTSADPVALCTPEECDLSSVSLSFSGGQLTLWSDPGTNLDSVTAVETQVQLQPGKPLVVGRQEGGEVPYLDPGYLPTHILPDSRQSVLTRSTSGRDGWVSRGHFLLKAVPDGVVLLNGVPRRGGGVRPPLNGTWLVEPQRRRMEEGEEYLIRKGAAARIELPNGVCVLIHAT